MITAQIYQTNDTTSKATVSIFLQLLKTQAAQSLVVSACDQTQTKVLNSNIPVKQRY